MKKNISTILFIVCVISLVACNKLGDDNKSEIDYPWEIGEKSNLKFYDGNINLSIDESRLTANGAEFILKSDEFIKYSDEFILEIQIDGKWYSINNESDWIAIEYTLQADSEVALEIDWTSRYGELPEGKYRFIKPITISSGEQYISCEFNF